MTDKWLIVGLGNPGSKYAGTRHNVGQLALDELARSLGARFSSHRTGNQLAECRMYPGGPKLMLIKPGTFMNLSGGPVAAAVKYFDLSAQQVIVLHDEIDIPFDSIRLKKGGGHGGHNGLRDIAKALNTPEFLRVRIGVGRPPGRQEVADFVLSQFTRQESQNLPVLLADAADAVRDLISEGLLAAQQTYHSRGKE